MLNGNSYVQLIGKRCIINGTSIEVQSSFIINEDNHSYGWGLLALTEDNIFISEITLTNNIFNLDGLQILFEAGIKQLESSNDEINGVAQSSGSAGATIKVKEPNFN